MCCVGLCVAVSVSGAHRHASCTWFARQTRSFVVATRCRQVDRPTAEARVLGVVRFLFAPFSSVAGLQNCQPGSVVCATRSSSGLTRTNRDALRESASRDSIRSTPCKAHAHRIESPRASGQRIVSPPHLRLLFTFCPRQSCCQSPVAALSESGSLRRGEHIQFVIAH